MHHVVLEHWSRGESFVHRRDPRAKVLALLAFLIAPATAHERVEAMAALSFVLLLVALLGARLPLWSALRRAAVVLPFVLGFAAISWLSGDPERALTLIAKSYLSSLAVLVLVTTTPLPRLLRGLESMGVPRFLLMVAQFLYRYLFVISEQAQHMRMASQCRGGLLRGQGFRAAAGALAVLFARSYARAESIHHAMIARGFQGHFQLLEQARFGWADALFLAGSAGAPIMGRLAL